MGAMLASVKVELKDALEIATSIRFLCTGNVVRSAFAELYARHKGCPLPVDSAATTFQNAAIFEETVEALREYGVPDQLVQAFRPRHLSRISTAPTPSLVLFGMTAEHLEHWKSRFPAHIAAFLLSDIDGSGVRISDPVMDGADFEQTYAQIAELVGQLIEHLNRGR
ncbi:MAG: protein-tyrosine-phosphatase [Planctomycetota bacterium]|jgi:protein-tyrosine-phosphatase